MKKYSKSVSAKKNIENAVQKKKKKISKSSIILIIVFIAGLFLLLYPSVSDYWNSFHQSRAIASYVDAVNNLKEEEYDRIWNEAIKYNSSLSSGLHIHDFTDEETRQYECLLNIERNGIMGYIEIPKIRVYLPIYHGTAESVLQVAIGHIEGTSLPVGGEGSHCVISGHRGLPTAKLFTNLDQLQEGDYFTITVLKEVLTYEVDQIRIVEPDDLDDLAIEAGQDYCTLVTCTPYGVNSHRLLIRGHRTENHDDLAGAASDALQFDPILVAPMIAAPLLILLMAFVLIHYRKKDILGAADDQLEDILNKNQDVKEGVTDNIED